MGDMYCPLRMILDRAGAIVLRHKEIDREEEYAGQ